MATEDIQKRTTRHVDNQLGGSDHLPITLEIADMKTTSTKNRKKAIWNLKKANWQKFQRETEDLRKITFTHDLNKNTNSLTLHILNAAKKSIPRGFRKDYKPYWSKTLETKHQELTTAREEMENNPTTYATTKHNNTKQEFNDTKMLEG